MPVSQAVVDLDFRGTPAGVWSRPRLDLYIAAPEDVAGLGPCLDAVIYIDGNRTGGAAEEVESACLRAASAVPRGPCQRWAQIAHKIGFKFGLFQRDTASGAALHDLRRALEDAEPAALACNATGPTPSED